MPKVKTIIKSNLSLPFPPTLSVDDLLERTRKGDDSKSGGKIPNCFLIYRILWVEYLKKINTKLDLPLISSFVSSKWKNEKREVKDYYKKLSTEANKRFNANNQSRVFIYHNQCDSNNTEKEISSIQSSAVNNPMSEKAAESPPGISIPFDVTSTQQNQQTQPQFNANFPSDMYSSFVATSPITNNLNFNNFNQNCSLKDIMCDTINSHIEVLTSDNYTLFNLSTQVTPEELGRVEKFIGYLKSIINEKSNSPKCIMLARFNAICEKVKELEFISTTKVDNYQDNYDFDPTRGIQGIPSDVMFNDNYESYAYQPVEDLITSLNSPSAGLYPNYLSDNPTFSSPQLNNNHLLTYLNLIDRNRAAALEERNKILEDKLGRVHELIKAIGGLICGNK